jgi:uncharacterized protein (DUF736 family)
MNEQLGRGTLRRNERKYEDRGGKYVAIAGKEKHPDYTGKVKLKVAGGEIDAYLSAWVRKNEDGKAFMSLTLEYPKNEDRQLTIANVAPEAIDPGNLTITDGGDEDLPF